MPSDPTTDPSVAERIVYRNLTVSSRIRAKRMVEDITTALAEARREVWEEAAKYICGHPEWIQDAPGNGKDCCLTAIEFRRRSRAQETQ